MAQTVCCWIVAGKKCGEDISLTDRLVKLPNGHKARLCDSHKIAAQNRRQYIKKRTKRREIQKLKAQLKKLQKSESKSDLDTLKTKINSVPGFQSIPKEPQIQNEGISF